MDGILRAHTAFLVAPIISWTSVIDGCKSSKSNAPSTSERGAAPNPSSTATQNECR